MKILIKNGTVIDPVNNIFDELDILIDEVIVKVDKNIVADDCLIIDAKNKWVCPGLIDLHVHLRDPGLTYKEDIESGSMSAKAGGFTTICAMPNTIPVTDNVETLKYVIDHAKKTGINVLPISAITKDQKGNELVNFDENKDLAIAFSEDGFTVENPKLMYDAIKIANKLNKPIFAHCEDRALKNGGQIHEGETAKKLGLKGIPSIAEDLIINRDILLAKEEKAKLHICHVATKESINIIRHEKSFNKNLTSEICPHHFVLCDEDIKELDTNFKMAPPLRSKEDVIAMKEALKDGTIDVIATDHAPHSKEEKDRAFEQAPNGIVGLETLVPLTITYLVNEEILSPKDFVLKTSTNPAKIINLDRGHLSVGGVADIAIIDVTSKYKIDITKFYSKSKNSPFNDYEVYGQVSHTICNGKIVYERD